MGRIQPKRKAAGFRPCFSIFVLALFMLPRPALPQSAQELRRRVLVGATLINPGKREVIRNSVIVVEGDRILRVGPEGSYGASPGDELIDCRGKFILPGMIDSHVHLERWSCEYLISFGVTTVRDCGNLIPVMKHFVDKIQKGEWIGPRISWGSPPLESVVNEADKKNPWKIRDPQHAAQLAGDLIAQGVQHIKVYNRIKESDLEAVIEVARKHRVPVIGHFRDVGAVKAAGLGVRSIEHGIGIPEDCLAQPLKLPDGYDDDNLSQRFRHWQFVIWKNIDDQRAEHVMDVLIENGVFVVATLVSDEVRKPAERQKELGFLWERLPKMFQQYSLNPGLDFNWSEEDYANFALSFAKEKAWFRRFFQKGGRIAAGTDSPVPFTVPGYSLHETLWRLASAGMPAMDVLKTATANAAELLGMEDRIGSIGEGKYADLVILDANPLEDIKNTLRIFRVMTSGAVYSPKTLIP